MGQPRALFVYFWSFQTNNIIFTTNHCEKLSIQYTELGFKPTTFLTRVVTHNHQTRAPALVAAFLFRNLKRNIDKLIRHTITLKLETHEHSRAQLILRFSMNYTDKNDLNARSVTRFQIIFQYLAMSNKENQTNNLPNLPKQSQHFAK